jgi:hypothetical protein
MEKKTFYFSLISQSRSVVVTENTKYALKVANPWAADRPAKGWPPEGHIITTPQWPSKYYPFRICLIMASTQSSR